MAWYNRLLNMVTANRHSTELDREMEFHLHERAEELRAAGLPDAEAAAEARRRFGNRTAQKERSHDAGVFTWVESVVGDVRYAVRALVASPGLCPRGRSSRWRSASAPTPRSSASPTPSCSRRCR